MIGENDEPIDPQTEDLQNFWHTSVGKFKFSVDDLPQPLQYIHQLLQVTINTLLFAVVTVTVAGAAQGGQA